MSLNGVPFGSDIDKTTPGISRSLDQAALLMSSVAHVGNLHGLIILGSPRDRIREPPSLQHSVPKSSDFLLSPGNSASAVLPWGLPVRRGRASLPSHPGSLAHFCAPGWGAPCAWVGEGTDSGLQRAREG